MLKAALRDSLAVGLACLPMGLAFGVLVAHSTLPWWWAGVFATVVFAGSLEFLLLGLVTGGVEWATRTPNASPIGRHASPTASESRRAALSMPQRYDNCRLIRLHT